MQEKSFTKALEDLINGYSLENQSGTPDFILAKYLHDCLAAYNLALQERARWKGEKLNG